MLIDIAIANAQFPKDLSDYRAHADRTYMIPFPGYTEASGHNISFAQAGQLQLISELGEARELCKLWFADCPAGEMEMQWARVIWLVDAGAGSGTEGYRVRLGEVTPMLLQLPPYCGQNPRRGAKVTQDAIWVTMAVDWGLVERDAYIKEGEHLDRFSCKAYAPQARQAVLAIKKRGLTTEGIYLLTRGNTCLPTKAACLRGALGALFRTATRHGEIDGVIHEIDPEELVPGMIAHQVIPPGGIENLAAAAVEGLVGTGNEQDTGREGGGLRRDVPRNCLEKRPTSLRGSLRYQKNQKNQKMTGTLRE